MQAALEELQALRLLRAFWEIKDPKAREAVIAFAEKTRRAEAEGVDHKPKPQ
ncbi:hypothetical protein JQ604_24615 [Bradyrhizobium jicamae]|uniref:hypothetical protein n=1 Tax=Bradyrhizobium jicamae TaxID=280332 RepID=UPI001BAB347D|nr:hypothetical protein [Bradyrhizobium jicamae]MBR0755377.1 hypothetical protein [Bradyrhizobium jicamae]